MMPTSLNMKTIFPLLIALSLMGLSCQLENPQDGIRVDEVITIRLSSNTVLADGNSFVDVFATLESESQANLPITFRTEAGTFQETVGGVLSPNGQRITLIPSPREAKVTLKADNIVRSRVELAASVNSLDPADELEYTATGQVQFVRAYPDQLFLSAAKDRLDAITDASTQLDVSLFRAGEGVTPSESTKVEFAVFALDSSLTAASVPIFAISQDGMAKADLTLNNLESGTLEVWAFVRDEALDTVAFASTLILVE